MAAVDTIKARLSIEDVVGSYIGLEPAGKYLRARCPFHNEKTASFVVTPDRGIFHCFGCGKGGDIFTFVQEIEHVPFREALESLASRAGVQLDDLPDEERGQRSAILEALDLAARFYAAVLPRTPEAVAYVSGRGITEDSVKAFGIGYAPAGGTMLVSALRKRGITVQVMEAAGLAIKGKDGNWYDRFRERVMFPMRDTAGRVVAFSGRVLPNTREAERGSAKYINSPETPVYHKGKFLYGLDMARKAIAVDGACICVEGQMDLVLAHQAGTANTVAVSGTAITEEHIRLLSRFTTRFVLALDADVAGIRAGGKFVQLAFAYDAAVDAIVLPDGQDPADLVRTQGADAWKAAVTAARPYLLVRSEALGLQDPQSRGRAVLSELAPLIAHYQSELLLDEAIRMVASAARVSPDALRSDVSRIRAMLGRSPRNPATAQPEPARVESDTFFDSREQTLDRLVGLLVDASPEDREAVRIRMDDLRSPGTFDAIWKSRESNLQNLAFGADMLYRGITDAEAHKKRTGLIEDWWRSTIEQDIKALSEEIARAEQSGTDTGPLFARLADLVKQRSKAYES